MSELRSVWLQELTWEDVADYLQENDTILFPIGSTEQHGPAGPLGVDSYAAISLAEDTARRTQVLVAPPLWYGDSPHHLAFPGTISLTTDTLVAVTKDVVRSLAKHGFKKIILINGHKGTNLAALTTACRTLHEYELPGVFLALADPLYLAKGISHIKDAVEHHAGELEISHVWYKRPELIKTDKLPGTQAVSISTHMSDFVHNDLFGKGGDSIEVFWNSAEQRKFAPSGSFSDASKASPEKGKLYHEYMVNNLSKFVEWLKQYDGIVGNVRD